MNSIPESVVCHCPVQVANSDVSTAVSEPLLLFSKAYYGNKFYNTLKLFHVKCNVELTI